MARPHAGGLKRTILFPLMLTADEYEYLIRLVKRRQDETRGKSGKVAGYLRHRAFPRNWRAQLLKLRTGQGANLK